MDMKAQIAQLVEKVKSDGAIQEKFKKDPEGTVKELLGGAADNAVVSKVIETVKGALGNGGLDEVKDKVSGLLGGILGKKD